MPNHEFKPGDIVKHTSSFLRSIGWYTDVPHNGRVVSADRELVTVEWSDGRTGRINSANIMSAGQPDTDA